MHIAAFLLSAGLGTRLAPLTESWPKCLMPINKVPLLEYWLERIRLAKINRVLVNTHFHADVVNSFLSRPKFLGWVSPINEEILLGTAASLRENFSFFDGYRVLLVHADNWCQLDLNEFIDFHINRRPKGTLISMVTFSADEPSECGIVRLDKEGRVIEFHEKIGNPPGNIANAAIYILEPEVLEWIQMRPRIVDFSLQVIPRFIGKIGTWHNSGIHRDIGTIKQLKLAQDDHVEPIFNFELDEWQDSFCNNPIHRRILEA
jgi:mannose-1-phosphate guanylyltransferase